MPTLHLYTCMSISWAVQKRLKTLLQNAIKYIWCLHEIVATDFCITLIVATRTVYALPLDDTEQPWIHMCLCANEPQGIDIKCIAHTAFPLNSQQWIWCENEIFKDTQMKDRGENSERERRGNFKPEKYAWQIVCFI